MTNLNSTYDVAIIGAGLAGCATAIGLFNMNPNLNIAIIDRSKLKPADTSDGAVYPRIGETVPPQIEALLAQLKILEAFTAKNYTRSYGTSSQWGTNTIHQNEYIFGTSGYGYVVDRLDFDALLLEQVRNLGVAIIPQTSIYKANKDRQVWKLQCLQTDSLKHELIQANFVVDASGRKAAFATLTGALKKKDDKLVSYYSCYTPNFNSTVRKQQGTLIESTAHGWWYSNTLNNGDRLVAYMTDSDIGKTLNLKDQSAFNLLLDATQYTKASLAGLEPRSIPKITAAHSQIMSNCSGDAWLAVGDAASCYDPLSALGMFKSLQSGLYASYAIYDYNQGNPLGVKKYEAIMQSTYSNYMQKKANYYAKEVRFADNPFWQRRLTA